MTTRELAKEIFDLTEELRLMAKIMRLEKEEDLLDYWEKKIIEAKIISSNPLVIKSVCDFCDNTQSLENKCMCKNCISFCE